VTAKTDTPVTKNKTYNYLLSLNIAPFIDAVNPSIGFL